MWRKMLTLFFESVQTIPLMYSDAGWMKWLPWVGRVISRESDLSCVRLRCRLKWSERKSVRQGSKGLLVLITENWFGISSKLCRFLSHCYSPGMLMNQCPLLSDTCLILCIKVCGSESLKTTQILITRVKWHPFIQWNIVIPLKRIKSGPEW